MKLTFNLWSPDEIIHAYIDFIKSKNAKTIHVDYVSDKYGFKETMFGNLELRDPRLTQLPKKISKIKTRHILILSQKDWKINCKLSLTVDPEEEHHDKVEFLFDDSLKKEILDHFKAFEPKEVS